MTVWQFNFGFRLAIYDILIIIFIFLAISYFFFKEEKILIDSNLKILVFFLFSWLILIMLSSQVILTNFPNPESISQYMKGLFNVIIRAMFLILFVFFLLTLNYLQRNKIATLFFVGVILSSFFGFLEFITRLLYDIDLNLIVWDKISFNANREEEFMLDSKYGILGLRRVNGFTGGPPSHATYIMTALPFYFVNTIQNKKLSLSILLLSFLLLVLGLTMSRTGFLSLLIAIAVYMILEPSKITKNLMAILLILSPMFIFTVVYWEYIEAILFTRFNMDSVRLTMYKSVMPLLEEFTLFGVGYNNYSIARFALESHDSNLHNSWLSIWVELGLIGFLFQIFYFGFILKTVLKFESKYSIPLFVSLCGLIVGGIFNSLFDLFYFQFWIVLFFTTIILEQKFSPTNSN
tara:strand:+ start:1462 stop:2679 length:1218 start_codon:yes stop_codon:yes gene_type:complete